MSIEYLFHPIARGIECISTFYDCYPAVISGERGILLTSDMSTIIRSMVGFDNAVTYLAAHDSSSEQYIVGALKRTEMEPRPH